MKFDHKEHYRFRADLLDGLGRDLLGPRGSADEELTDPPATTYATGILFPRKKEREVNYEADIDLASSTVMAVDDVVDTGVAMANVQTPSSMGLTFAVDALDSQPVTVLVDVACYRAIDDNGDPVVATRVERRSTEEKSVVWRRNPYPQYTAEIDVRHPPKDSLVVTEGLQLRLRVRAPREGSISVTATLVNVNDQGPFSELQDGRCFFQPRITVRGSLVERRGPSGGGESEVVGNRLLHRYAPTFAVGHGCSVEWDWTPPSAEELVRHADMSARLTEVRTTFVPSHEVLLTESNPDIKDDALAMQILATADESFLFEALSALVVGYRDWISQRRSELMHLPDGRHDDHRENLRDVAEEHLRRCEEAARRIENGIKLLRREPAALQAFRLANEAMARQRGQAQWIKNGRVGKVELDSKWRPFQIAFMLQCLDGIFNPEHDDRSVVDLVWFPTGGGKTEAYLGLIAFTVFLRRIRRGESGGGVTAIMRYTLRLLTLQQFERAASLICAMEYLRSRQDTVLGAETISLGMWVGKAATPNFLVDAKAALDRLGEGEKLQTENPVQLRRCPWCGVRLDHLHYKADLEARMMTIACGTPTCEFRNGLPVHVVDDMVYQARPTLVIATSDKFARLPWRDDVAALFNRDDASGNTPPPELIVQDELHLISGPLGSLAGIYETAIDEAADHPKVIASTATIRRADEQGARLFNRKVAQFPPPGLDARDSWFAVQTSRDKKASRLYAGVITPNTSQATLLVRTYAALLHHAARVDGTDKVRDAYWTLVGYFNSLRLLASAELQVRADVQERLGVLAKQIERDRRTAEILIELNSRVASSDIPERLEELALTYPNTNVPDVVLATNMISVGVDVDRLGLMAIMGQPQTTAEYIQSSSRVGRQHPGLVVIMFNSARSRDRSHYENFLSYHSALYRQVESTSVTPFSSRARDRALHAVLVGMARLMIPDARENESAADIERFKPRLQELKTLILTRVGATMPEEHAGTARQLDSIIEKWSTLAAQNEDLVYDAERRPGRTRPHNAALLCTFTDVDLLDATETLWSLRDVDTESDLYLER